jgi:hypothetical protein
MLQFLAHLRQSLRADDRPRDREISSWWPARQWLGSSPVSWRTLHSPSASAARALDVDVISVRWMPMATLRTGWTSGLCSERSTCVFTVSRLTRWHTNEGLVTTAMSRKSRTNSKWLYVDGPTAGRDSRFAPERAPFDGIGAGSDSFECRRSAQVVPPAPL